MNGLNGATYIHVHVHVVVWHMFLPLRSQLFANGWPPD